MSHQMRYCLGLERTLQRHLRLQGLVPSSHDGKTPARLVKAPAYYNEGRRKEARARSAIRSADMTEHVL